MALPQETPARESGLELFAVLLAGGILFAIAATIFVLIAPHAPGGWRPVTAAAAVGAVLAVIDLAFARRFQRQGAPRALGRYGIALIGGVTLGLLWAAVAGHRPLWESMAGGGVIALLNTAFGGFWRRRRAVRAPSA
jgi:hypothetical protein